MDTLLQTVIIVFLIFLCTLCMFAVVVILRDIITESARNRRSRDNVKEDEQPATPAIPVVSDVPAADEHPAPTETGVVFSKHNPTMEEKYIALSSEYKSYFNEIVRFALSKEGVKEFKYNSSFDYKDGSYRVLRLTVKRDEIYCELTFINREMMNYATQGNVKFKQSATAIKLTDPSSVSVVKDGINLVCTQIAEDREYKKNRTKEKRREKARAKAAETATAEPATA